MDLQTFLALKTDQLENLSGIDGTRWSKYFNGTPLNERTLYRLSTRLNMRPSDLLLGLNIKRRERGKILFDPSCLNVQDLII